MTTIIAPNGSRITVPDPTPVEVASSMSETCLRIVTREIHRGNLSGALSPDPLSKWRVTWAPIYDGSPVIEVSIQCAAETSQDERTAAYNRLAEFGTTLVVPLGRTRGIAFNMSLDDEYEDGEGE
jgi:hypothetical protein